nr:dimethyl sulfone monooxygenase SfnG [Pseudomonas prosekii]
MWVLPRCAVLLSQQCSSKLPLTHVESGCLRIPCGEGACPRLSAQRSPDSAAATQPNGGKPPRHGAHTPQISAAGTVAALLQRLPQNLAAKQLATIDQLTNGRVAVNIVSGWFKGEFQAIGEHWLEHDERYRRSEEFIRSLKGIWSQDNFNFRGDFYRFDNYSLKPKPLGQPEIFQGGSSRAARDMAARVSDWYFTNGNTPEGIKAQVDDIRSKATANNHSVKVGVNAFVIARDTEEEARAVLAQIIDQADPQAVNAFGDAAKQAGRASPEGEGNWAKSTFEDLVQYNDGFKTNLIGTPQQIAERIVALKAVGVDLVLAGFLHFQEEVEYFGKRVLPLVRELEAKALNQQTAAVA